MKLIPVLLMATMAACQDIRVWCSTSKQLRQDYCPGNYNSPYPVYCCRYGPGKGFPYLKNPYGRVFNKDGSDYAKCENGGTYFCILP
ncbi:uncharacterized protein UV8b_05060 [Ustilaginoidea virens]|uniref:Uncharacterized protein n=1 Tax=Ustilaginoidea virens TaxID=1159556 RepID=A0A8E5HTB2_USTVR|nr:uncharacterized protein UV8b_05060 [Ustilaginoidea virens]QUC20819.1 hypothetical protein UV8b_05060 [Ustilaginoidea virens]